MTSLSSDWLALPGIPAGAEVWEHHAVRSLQFQGVQDQTERHSWHLDSFVAEVLPQYDEHTILIGHDLGGVIASMSALQKPPKAVILTGTALGAWWFWTRLSARPVFNRFFYHTFKGNLFVRLGGGQSSQQRFSGHPHFHDPTKMQRLAKEMRPPAGLARMLGQTCPVFLVWGKQEVFYPGFIAKHIAKQTGGDLYWNDGGHYCMWTHAKAFHEHLVTIETRLP